MEKSERVASSGTYQMTKKIINTKSAPQAIGPYSQAVLADQWLFISGQIPIDPASGQLVTGDIVKETERVLENIKGIIESAGGNLGDVVKTTVYLKNMADFPQVNEVYARYFTEDYPARATVEVSRLPKDVRIEMDAIALIS